MNYFLGALGVLLIPVLMVGLWFMGTYNTLVELDQQTELSWAQVETQYQRRFDLVPNLVSATKATMVQEREVFGAIADARTRYAGSEPNTAERAEAIGGYESALSRLLVVMENYPTLQSNETVRGLMDELTGTENRVTYARGQFNETVKKYNVRTTLFPGNIVAGFFGFERKELFESEQGSEVAPDVNLDI